MPRPAAATATTAVDDEAGPVDAAAVLSSLGVIVGVLKRAPIPEILSISAAVGGLRPKPRHVAALLQVADGRRLSVTELADRLRVSLATASQLVTDLSELGLVHRVEDPADRRRTLVEVADVHRPMVDAVLDWRLRPVQRALGRLSPEERTAVLTGLERLAAAMSGSDPSIDTADDDPPALTPAEGIA